MTVFLARRRGCVEVFTLVDPGMPGKRRLRWIKGEGSLSGIFGVATLGEAKA
jgi:hypothetical protein|tara:strand:- start:3136 stop:3291 length:156 start_codon:yes stop_codon:yes gene_type:complete